MHIKLNGNISKYNIGSWKYLYWAKGARTSAASKQGKAIELLARYRDEPDFKDVKTLASGPKSL